MGVQWGHVDPSDTYDTEAHRWSRVANEPTDAVHAASLEAIGLIRADVARIRRRIQRWTPRKAS